MILGFKDTFVPAVADGTKPHTIRSGSRWKVGMPIQFYRNVRQRDMTKIRPDAVVTAVQRVFVEPGARRGINVFVAGRSLTPLECQELARRDGFQDFDELVRFISQLHGLPFEGQLIHWTDLRY